jgi:hypothetical protein
MNERTLERVGALTGVVFVILSLLAGFLYPQQPRVDSAPAVTLAWVHAHRVALQSGMILGMFAAALLIWFVGHLRHVLDRAEGGAESLSPIVFGSGIAVAVMAAIATLPTALLAFMDAQPGGIQDGTLVRMLGDLNIVLFALSAAMTAVFLAAAGMAMVRKEMVAPWVGWLAIIVALFNAICVPFGATFSTYHGKAWDAVAWVAYLGFLLVILVSSLAMLTGRGARTGQVAGRRDPVLVP